MSAAEEFDPKKRLVGAGILVGLAVIILPAILDGDEDFVTASATEEAQRIEALENNYVSSEEEVTVFVSKITPIETSSGSIGDNSQASGPVASGSIKEMSSTPAKPESGSNPSKIIERGWVVRVGVFTDVENVKEVLVDLKEKGFAPDTESIDISVGKATRIWIGPYEQRVEAARARTRLEQQIGLLGTINAFP